jgi:hypothetical protein
VSALLLAFVLAASPAPSPSPQATEKPAKKAEPAGQKRSYGEDDLDRVAGRKPWYERKPGDPENQPKDPPGYVESPERPTNSDTLSPELVQAKQRVSALKTEIAELDKRIASLDSQSRQLLTDRLMSTDTNEIMRLMTEQGQVEGDLKVARERAVAARAELVEAEKLVRGQR